MFSCILLAAGENSRFGYPKGLATAQNRTVVQHIQETLVNSQINEIIVVLGAQKEKIEPHLLKHKKLIIVHNKDHKLGQTSSFKAGIKQASIKAKGFLLMPVDCPWITTATINSLLEHFTKTKPLILVPKYKDRNGHPPIFHKKLLPELLNLDTSVGVNSFIHAHQNKTEFLSTDDIGTVLTFNTQEEFQKAWEQRPT